MSRRNTVDREVSNAVSSPAGSVGWGLRRRLGVDGDGEVELTELNDKLEISAASTPMHTERTAGGVLVLRHEHELPTMSVDTVRDVLDRPGALVRTADRARSLYLTADVRVEFLD